MTIQHILDRKGSEVFTIHPTAMFTSAAVRMREHNVAALVAQNGDTIVGIVSERDCVNAVARTGERACSMTVEDIMTRAIVTIVPTDSIAKAMSLMTRHRVRHLPVIVNGKLFGIVSIGDVIKQRLEDLETESNVLRDLYIAAH
jgi:CBS domain-containing protein